MAYLEPTKKQPEAKDVKLLYEALWRTGPTSLEILGRRASKLPLGNYFMLVTIEEIDGKIKRIRNKTASGPHGLLKKNLLIPGLPIILAKLFNMLWYSS